LLKSLPPADFALISPYLRVVDLVQTNLLAETGKPFSDVYFPHSGVISLVVNLSEGEAVEVAMIGIDTAFGASAALGNGISLNEAIVQLSGTASVVEADRLRAAVAKSETLRKALILNERIIFAQAQQSAACNASHNVESRLCRWLLRLRDLAGSDALQLTQEYLAQMIGAKRNSVSLVANNLQNAGLISYKRADIHIVDVHGVMARSCECYQAFIRQVEGIQAMPRRHRGFSAAE
jgi:CRP-like cAMP-binding protein